MDVLRKLDTDGEATSVYISNQGSSVFYNDSKEGFVETKIFYSLAFSIPREPHKVTGFSGFGEEDVIIFGKEQLSFLDYEEGPGRIKSSLHNLQNVHNFREYERTFLLPATDGGDGKVYQVSLESGSLLRSFETKSQAYDIDISDDLYGYIAEAARGLTRYKMSAEFPYREHKHDFSEMNAHKIQVYKSDYAFVAGHVRGRNNFVVKAMDIGNPYYFREKKEFSSRAESGDILLRDDYLYLAMGNNLAIYNLDEDDEDYLLDSTVDEITLKKPIRQVLLNSNHNKAYAIHSTGFTVVSLRDKDDIEVLEEKTVTLSDGKYSIYNNRLIGVGTDGIKAFYIGGNLVQDFTLTAEQEFFQNLTGEIYAVYADSDDLYISHEKRGLLKIAYKVKRQSDSEEEEDE